MKCLDYSCSPPPVQKVLFLLFLQLDIWFTVQNDVCSEPDTVGLFSHLLLRASVLR